MTNEVGALRAAGHEVALVAARTDDLESKPGYAVTSAARVATGAGRSPLERLRAFGPDVVHVHNLFPNWASRWLRRVPVPLVVTLHNYRSICAKATLFRDGHVCTDCPDGTSASSIAHACYRGSWIATIPLALATRRPLDERDIVSSARRIIVLNETAREVYARYGAPRERLVVWPNFVPSAEDPGPSAGAARSTWLFVGRLGDEKGIAKLVRRWPADAPLTVIGDGPDRTVVQHAARGKRIDVLGLQPANVVREAMASAVGLVIPSTCYENFPMVYAEAMASGLPVLAWRPNVVAGMVEEQGTGSAVSWEDDVAHILSHATRSFPALRERCRAVFDETMSERAYVRRAEALYSDLVGSPGAGRDDEPRGAADAGTNSG